MIILDTNVVSEIMRPAPDPGVGQWVRAQAGTDLATTAVTVAEIRYGIARLPGGHRRDVIRATADEVFARFGTQVLPFDADAAAAYAAIVVRREEIGLPIDGFDAQIAAICEARGATVATCNTKDFRHTGIDVVDPWRT